MSRVEERVTYERRCWLKQLERSFPSGKPLFQFGDTQYFVCSFILVADYRKNVQYLGTNVRSLDLHSKGIQFTNYICVIVRARRANRSYSICVREGIAESSPHPWLAKGNLENGC